MDSVKTSTPGQEISKSRTSLFMQILIRPLRHLGILIVLLNQKNITWVICIWTNDHHQVKVAIGMRYAIADDIYSQ